jgi:AcrR family transcriptional regulator
MGAMSDADARTRLREAALDLFGRRGVHATSTRAILREAGLRNPSAISYHFGSKAGLVDDLVRELIDYARTAVDEQIALAAAPERPSPEAWARIAVDSAAGLVTTERGCLLARVWWDYDASVHPHAFEAFLASGHPTAIAWQDAVERVFPDLPRLLAVSRNVIMLRTIEWMITRRANRLLLGAEAPLLRAKNDAVVRQIMLEAAVGILAAPTALGPDAISLG